ncbi:hypothetical protein ACO0SA_002043 [Hanseniaspora valbyensis]
MKVSKFNNVYGETKAYKKYTGLKLSNTAPDSTLVKSNGKYLSCIWVSRGGGAFAILPLENEKNPKELNIKVPDIFPLFRGHKDQVLDVDFDPFNQQRCVSCSNDSDIFVWDIPEDFNIYGKLDDVTDFQEPVRVLNAHTKKVLQVLYHPIAKDILASTSMDKTVKIWNIATGEVIYSIEHPEWVTSISFNYNGKYLATCCKDKKLRIYSFEKEGEPELYKTFPTHPSPKNAKCCFLGVDEVVTCGFNGPERQFAMWNVDSQEDGSKPMSGFLNVDVSPSVILPFADKSLDILFLAGKGDSTVKLYEKLDNGNLHELTDFTSTEPQKGFCIAPRLPSNTDVRKNELLRGYRTLNDKAIEEISFKCPLKTDKFQNEIYPDGQSSESTLTAEEWINHKNRGDLLPIVFQFKDVYEGNDLSFSTATSMPVSKQGTPKPLKKTKDVEDDKQDFSIPSPASAISNSTSHKETEPVTPTPKQKQIKKEEEKEEEKIEPKIEEPLKSVDEMFNNAEDPSFDDNKDGEWEVVETPTKKKDIPIKNDTPKEPTEQPQSPIELKKEEKPVPKPDVKVEKIDPITPTQSKQSETKKIVVDESPITVKTETVTKKTLLNTPSKIEKEEKHDEKNKTLSLRQSVEKLSSLVLNLTDLVDNLKSSNLEKDERLKALEAKIEDLISSSN